MTKDLQRLLDARFQDAPNVAAADVDVSGLLNMSGRGSCRTFKDMAVPDAVLDILCAAALAAPTKSDLQQRDIILLKSPSVRASLAGLVAGQPWVADAPMIAVFCGNNRRQRLLHDWQDIPFANNHLDAMFNAATDAAIALGAFVTAAEAIGFGCCPISGIRNEVTAVSKLLGLPKHVFPFAGLAIGYPDGAPVISKRLPLRVTCHTDSYKEHALQDAVQSYDDDRAASHPYAAQRFADTFGMSDTYGWSEDKARQYSAPERADFGAYLRAQGFKLD